MTPMQEAYLKTERFQTFGCGTRPKGRGMAALIIWTGRIGLTTRREESYGRAGSSNHAGEEQFEHLQHSLERVSRREGAESRRPAPATGCKAGEVCVRRQSFRISGDVPGR